MLKKNAKIDEAEAAVKKYASKDTVISIGGYEFTPAKLLVTLLRLVLGETEPLPNLRK